MYKSIIKYQLLGLCLITQFLACRITKITKWEVEIVPPLKKDTMQINTNYNYKQTNKRFETVPGKSKTIPDETYSIKELYAKHTRGILPEGLDRQPIWSEDAAHTDPDLQKINRMDITDKHIIQKETKKRVDAKQRLIEDAYDKKAKRSEAKKEEAAPMYVPAAPLETKETIKETTPKK